jgi:hypothetical protein
MLVSGATVSRFTVLVFADPGPAPVLPALSDAVHVMLWVPSPDTVTGALADGVLIPLMLPTTAPGHEIAVILLLPVVESSAVTEPITGTVSPAL